MPTEKSTAQARNVPRGMYSMRDVRPSCRFSRLNQLGPRQIRLSNRVFKSYADIIDTCCAAWNALARGTESHCLDCHARLRIGQSLTPVVS